MKKEATPLIVYKRPEVDVLSFELEQICLTGSGLEDMNPDEPEMEW